MGFAMLSFVMAAFYKVLSIPIVKIALVGVAVTSGAIAVGFPLHDIWFDYTLFVVASAIVAGMPEPDTELPFRKFVYLWFYRSAHLIVASATAYFIHKSRWPEIKNTPESEGAL